MQVIGHLMTVDAASKQQKKTEGQIRKYLLYLSTYLLYLPTYIHTYHMAAVWSSATGARFSVSLSAAIYSDTEARCVTTLSISRLGRYIYDLGYRISVPNSGHGKNTN